MDILRSMLIGYEGNYTRGKKGPYLFRATIPPMNPSRNGFILAIFACLIAFSASVWMATGSGNAQAPTPPSPAEGVDMIAFPDIMVPPVLPENPTQADYGRQVYYYVCMTCHGNLGQGLTQEWIDAWGEENSCWQ